MRTLYARLYRAPFWMSLAPLRCLIFDHYAARVHGEFSTGVQVAHLVMP